MIRLTFGVKVCLFVAAVIAPATQLVAQTRSEILASVKVPQAVLANGQPLAPGTYTLRLASDAGAAAAAPTSDGSRWIEFVQNGQVMGREMPTVVVAGSDAQSVLKGPGPAPGTARVQLLKGNEYLRIWINTNGTHYLIHLPVK